MRWCQGPVEPATAPRAATTRCCPRCARPAAEGRRHDPDEFVGVARTKDAADAQLSNLCIRNGDMSLAVPIISLAASRAALPRTPRARAPTP